MKQRDLLWLAGCGALGVLVLGAGAFGAGVAWWAAKPTGPSGAAGGARAPGEAALQFGVVVPGATAPPAPPPGMEMGAGHTVLPPAALTLDRCQELKTGGPVADGCYSGELRCGDIVTGHTRGGVKRFDTAFYERHTCSPGTRDWDGGDERVYRFVAPPGEMHAVITLDTPCADLTLAAMTVPSGSGSACPAPNADIARCEMNRQDGTKREFVELVSQGGSTWAVVVEGVNAEEGMFALQVRCYAGLYGYTRELP